MKHMTFENFRVDNGNRAAYDLCRRAAMLEYEAGRPVVLLGPAGAGKSHLLWSVVAHVRASSARAGLALVMASEFPEQVRQLAVNPAPLQDGKPSLLLVDELEHFEQDAYTLEGVVKVFLANGHGVILASAAHPDRLAQFSEGFRALLCGGLVVEVGAAGALLEDEEQELALVEALRAERDALELKLAQKAGESAEMANVRVRLDEAMRQVEQLTIALADTSRFDALHQRHQAELAAVAAEREDYKLAVEALHEERDALEKRLADRTAAAAEADMLRERLLGLESAQAATRAEEEGEIARLRGELAAAQEGNAQELVEMRARLSQAEESAARANEMHASHLDRINHLQAELSEYRGGLEEARDLRRQLEEAQVAALRAHEEYAEAVRAAEEMGGLIEAERATAAAELEAVRAEIHALLDSAKAHGPANPRELEAIREGLQDAQSLSAAFRMQMDRDRRDFEEETAQLQAENAALRERAEHAMAELARTTASTEGQKARARTLEYELEKERKQNALLAAEMDALRSEAASQVAQANVRGGELEGRMAQLREALELVMQRGKSAAQHADLLSAAFAQAAAALDAARDDLAALALPGDVLAEDEPSNGVAQPSLFDTAPFMRDLAALPGAFPPPQDEDVPADAPSPLLDLVEEALGGEGRPEQ